jgi:hypothetical protein
MRYIDFEDKLRKNISTETAPVDMDALMTGIFEAPQSKRKISYGYWIGAATLVLGTLLYFATTFATYQNDNPSSVDQATSSQKKTAHINNSTHADLTNNDTTFQIESNQIIDPINQYDPLNHNQADIENKNKITYSKNSKSNLGYTHTVKNIQPITLSENKSNEDDNHTPSSQINNDKNANSSSDHLTSEHYTQTSKNLKSTLGFLPIPSIAQEKLNYIRKLKMNKDVICPDFRLVQRWHIALVPQAGLYLPMKKLNDQSIDNADVFMLRNENEKTLEGWHAGLGLRLEREKFPFYFTIAGQYGQHTERMNLKYDYLKRDTTQGIISITVSQNGDTITAIIGDIITTKRITGSKTVHHGFRMWDLPMGIGYRKSLGNWDLTAEAGTVLNMSSRLTGRVLNTPTTFTDIDSAPNPHFTSRLRMSYYIQAAIERPISDHVALGLGMRYRHIPGTFTTSAATVGQRYHFLGLQASVIYRL